jgi:uncharacterized membrane protein YraQ (UPF0718 family)
MNWFHFSWQSFWFSFLALALEGLPFILAGSIVSGAIAAFMPSRLLTRLLPRNPVLATLASGLLGIVFPVCECGVVPVVKRLLRKGLPLSCGVTYMLASPIVNPIVAFSTYAAFRGQAPGQATAIRLALGYLVAVLAGLSVLRLNPSSILKQSTFGSSRRKRVAFTIVPLADSDSPFRAKVTGAVRLACDDFIDTAIYFMVGAAVAATFNTAVDQRLILPLAANPTLATIAMMSLSGVLTLCSTSDAFIAATFVSFPFVAQMAFLVFGPMFDFKLLFLYSALFKKRFVAALGVALFCVIGVLCSQVLVHVWVGPGPTPLASYVSRSRFSFHGGDSSPSRRPVARNLSRVVLETGDKGGRPRPYP